MVIERSSALVKAACMPRLAPPETLTVEVMAELMTKGAEERAEGGDLFPDGGPHPETDEHRFGMVVPEQFNSRTALANSQRAGCKHSDPWGANLAETSALHGGSDGTCRRLQPVVLGDFQSLRAIGSRPRFRGFSFVPDQEYLRTAN